MTTWDVRIGLRAPADQPVTCWREIYPVLDDTLKLLTGSKGDTVPIVTVADETGLNLSFRVQADTIWSAVMEAHALLHRASGVARLPRLPVTFLGVS